MKIYGFIIRTACYLKDLHFGNDIRMEKCWGARSTLCFFNENAKSKIFFTILDIRIYGESFMEQGGRVMVFHFSATPFDAQHSFIYVFYCGVKR